MDEAGSVVCSAVWLVRVGVGLDWGVGVMDRDDLMWFAGLCEGEAWFGVSQSGRARLSIEATDRDVVGRAAMLMRGSVRARLQRTDQARPTYICEVSGGKAVRMMKELLPHMGARRSSRILEILHSAGESLDSTGLHCPPGLVAV